MSVRQQLEIAELQQALFDIYVALGEDTDGIPDGPTFARTVSPYPDCIVEAARLTRKEYEAETAALTAQLQAAQALADEAEAQLAYIGAGCVSATREELVKRITAVGVERHKVAHWLSSKLRAAKAEQAEHDAQTVEGNLGRNWVVRETPKDVAAAIRAQFANPSTTPKETR